MLLRYEMTLTLLRNGDDPKYDCLGEFYSSHMNLLFWRLHEWVDDRIEDWFNAHEAARPGEIEWYEFQGITWFKPGNGSRHLSHFIGRKISNTIIITAMIKRRSIPCWKLCKSSRPQFQAKLPKEFPCYTQALGLRAVWEQLNWINK